MGFSQLFIKVRRWISRKLEDLWDLIPLQKPRRYKKTKKKSRQYKDEIEYERNVHHIPFYRKFKTLLAAGLLGLNLVFSQFLLGSQSAGQIMFLLFLGNSFILADYLWKMRKKKDDE